MYKAVIDTSVFIAGTISATGASRDVIDAMSAGLFIPVASEEIIAELVEVSQRPKFEKFFNKAEAAALIESLHRHALIVHPTIPAKPISIDADDDKFLMAALMARANFIVSLDKPHLLNLKTFHKIPIVRPREFIEALRNR